MVPCHLQTVTVLLLSFFPIWTPFISFFPLIVVVRSSKTLLSKSAKSAHGLVLFSKWHWEY